MLRRLRREFQNLEAQLEPDAHSREWRALIDKVLYNKGEGPKPIVEQLRLRERLRTLHARRDRYNQKRRARRYGEFLRQLRPRHVIATLAIQCGIVEPEMGIRDMAIGAMAGDRRLSRRFLEELETVHETIFPAVRPGELDHGLIARQRAAKAVAREERKDFERALMPTALPARPPAAIPFGYPQEQTDAPPHQVQLHTARAAS